MIPPKPVMPAEPISESVRVMELVLVGNSQCSCL
ncbi:hypothetical protein BH18PSE1_BH18PSE1_11540 [soil metagenome]